MKLKKILAVGMASLLAAAALTGCGGEKKNVDNGKKVQIEYWHVAAESFGGATVKAAPFPAFNGKEVKFPAGGNFLMVFSKNVEKQKAAVEFIKYLESPAALAKWSTGTGYLPPRKGVADDPQGFKKLADENPNIKMALEQMAKVTKWSSFPGANGLQAEQLLIDARDIILSGKMTAADALHQTAEKINKLL